MHVGFKRYIKGSKCYGKMECLRGKRKEPWDKLHITDVSCYLLTLCHF